MTIPESTLEDIKSRIDIVDLVSSYGIQLKHSGSGEVACCPFHNEKTPSFHVYRTKGFYHCFGCGVSGDAFKFVQEMDGLSFLEAAEKLAERCGVKIVAKEDPDALLRKRLYSLMSELSQFYHRCLLKTKEGRIARDYLASRSIPEQVWVDYAIGYAPVGISAILKWADKYSYTPKELEAAGVIKCSDRPNDAGYHRFGGRLIFTIKDKQGRVVAFSGRQLVEDKKSGKYVNSPETLIFKKSKVLFGFDKAAGAIGRTAHREVICCEGQIDTIRLHVCGFGNAVASQGTAFTEEHAKMIKRVADAAVLMYDDDGAGHKATVRVARMLLAMEMPVRVVGLPGGDDPDSFLRRHAPEEMQSLIDKAESIIAFQFRIESEREANPATIDAATRISRQLIETISVCPSAILRVNMVNEAAKLLKLPTSAVEEELEKQRQKAAAFKNFKRGTVRAKEALEEDEISLEDEGYDPEHGFSEPPSQRVPPPDREISFMAFLLANEYDQKLETMIVKYLPDEVFADALTRRFVGTWRLEANTSDDLIGSFADSLDESDRAVFDKAYVSAEQTQADRRTPSETMREYVRSLWYDKLCRERGELPVDGGAETEMRRMKISLDLKLLRQAEWDKVETMIEDLMEQ